MIAAVMRVGRLVRPSSGLGRLAAASWGQVVAALASLVALRFYTAQMPPAAFGSAMLVLGVLTFIDGVFGMAFNQTLTMLLSELTERRARLALGLGLGLLFARLTLVVTAVFAALAIAAMLLGVAMPLFMPVLLAALLYCAVEPVRIVGQSVLLLERRFMAMSSWMAADALLTVGATLVWLRWVGPSAISLCVGLVIGRAIATSVFWTGCFGLRALRSADLATARATQRRALAFALPVSAMGPLGWASIYIDRYVVGATVGLASAGLLAALSGAVTRPFSIVSAALTTYYRPEMLDRAAGRGRAGARPLRDWMLVALVGGGVGVAFMAIFGRMVTAFLIKFRTGADAGPTLLLLIAISQVLVLLTHAVDNQVLTQRRSRALLTQQSIAVTMGLPMIAVGAVMGGVVGAAWGRIANEGVKLLLASWLAVGPGKRRP